MYISHVFDSFGEVALHLVFTWAARYCPTSDRASRIDLTRRVPESKHHQRIVIWRTLSKPGHAPYQAVRRIHARPSLQQHHRIDSSSARDCRCCMLFPTLISCLIPIGCSMHGCAAGASEAQSGKNVHVMSSCQPAYQTRKFQPQPPSVRTFLDSALDSVHHEASR